MVALLFSFNITAHTQKGRKPHAPEKRVEKQTSQMVEKLQLDEVQTAKVKELNLAYAKKNRRSPRRK